jgi:uncharacterized Zn-binding protein involved in type VI secretion
MNLPTSYALVGSDCEADGHPSECQEPAPGTIQNTDSNAPLTVDGTVVADHGDDMHFDSHAHDTGTDSDGNTTCTDTQSHDLTPDQINPWTIDGRSLILVGDSTTDPGSGGTAEVVSTSQSAFELVD